MTSWILLLCAIFYVAVLFAIALYGDSERGIRRMQPFARYIFALSLAVYCSSWTFYGAVGNAVSTGWGFLPIYLGPILVFIFGRAIIDKMVRVGKRQNTTSIADFIASRYGKRRNIATVATLICTVAGIPYIALQLQAVTNSLDVFGGANFSATVSVNTALLVALGMIAFAILFGTRQVDASKHNHGIMLTIAFESVIKLSALIALALFVIFYFYSGPSEFLQELETIDRFDWPGLDLNFVTQLILASGAILVLPRQFHVMVVENTHRSHLTTARWVFPVYLTLISLVVLPITAAGMRLFGEDGINPDTYVLLLPHVSEQSWLTLFVFLGGFSASMAMIVITTLALSTMLSNNAVYPLVIHKQLNRGEIQVARRLLMIRRAIVIAVILSAWYYAQLFGNNDELSEIGLLAFSLVVQLLPALLLGLFWRKAHAHGALAGMIVGSLIWAWTLLVPVLQGANFLPLSLLSDGPWGVSWLRPEQLFGIQFPDPLSHGVFFSLGFNIIALIAFSYRAQSSLTDRLQASAFVYIDKHLSSSTDKPLRADSKVRNSDLVAMLERFAGINQSQRWISDFERVNHLRILPNETPSQDFVRYIERTLSGVIGASSARAMIHSAVAGGELNLEDVVTFFDETTQAIQFNQKVLSSTLENLDHGVSVIDRDFRLVAWNRRYTELYPYPKDMLRVGAPIADLVRFNAKRGECGPGDIEDHVRKRIEHLRSELPHRFIRVRNDGSVIEIKGNPLPGGGFVTTFNDISDFVKAQNALKEAKQGLERRVTERTIELEEEIAERERTEQLLMEAKTEAELANESKTRFLALASHDILQPLNAARLYSSSLMERYSQEPILPKLDSALKTTEDLLSTLLEIAKLDGNPTKANLEPVSLAELFESIDHEFSGIADEKALRFMIRPTQLWVLSEAKPLRRIIQNLVSNALKYTPTGGVLLASRKRHGFVTIEVYDTGLGIELSDQSRIFHDFSRLDQHASVAEGVGLGLSVVTRISNHLGHPIGLRSAVGKGSVFSVRCALAHASKAPTLPRSQPASQQLNLCVAVIDNDLANVDALTTLLRQWGCEVISAINAEQAMQLDVPDAIVIDYQLGEKLTGFELYAELCHRWQREPSGILVTAHGDSMIKKHAGQLGLEYLSKPVKPAPLRAFLKSVASDKIGI